MRGCASLGVVEQSGAFREERAVVFVDGVPEPRLAVVEYVAEGVLDRRWVELVVVPGVGDGDAQGLVRGWRGSAVVVASANRLVDGQVRWSVLVRGVLSEAGAERGATRGRVVVQVEDAWGAELDGSLGLSWWQSAEGGLVESGESGVMRVGDRANRSRDRWLIGGELVYVFEEGGEAWTVGDALETISALGGLRLSGLVLGDGVRSEALTDPLSLEGPIGGALERLLTREGLVIRRELSMEGGVVLEDRSVRAEELGRRVRVPWVSPGRGLSEAMRIDSDGEVERAKAWRARAGGWVVESTFSMVHGWDPGLEGQADEAYSKSGNEEFATYANVYRQWVLNEDGGFSGLPFDQGDAFDLGGFFGVGVVRGTALRFLACLTLDDSGDRRSVIVEMSTDGGLNWSAYPGVARVLGSRAGVYLDDVSLPGEFLAAAKLGQARVRVTGSLQSPVGVEELRWSGNPFLGADAGAENVLDAGDGFEFKRVDQGSIHHAGVADGSLVAEEVDDGVAMQRWLIGRMDRAGGVGRGVGGVGRGKAVLDLVGARAWLRVGDRVIDVGGRGRGVGGRAEAIAAAGAVVRGVRCRWSDPTIVGRVGRTGAGRVETRLTIGF